MIDSKFTDKERANARIRGGMTIYWPPLFLFIGSLQHVSEVVKDSVFRAVWSSMLRTLFTCREVGKVLCSTCTAVVLFPFIQITFQHDLIDRLMTSNKRGSPLGIPLLLFKQLRKQTASMPLFTKSSGTCNFLLQPIFHLCRQVSLSYGEKFTYTTATISSWLQAEFSKNLAPREGYHDLGLAGI